MRLPEITRFNPEEWKRLTDHTEPGIGVFEAARRWSSSLVLIVGLHLAAFFLLALL